MIPIYAFVATNKLKIRLFGVRFAEMLFAKVV